MFNLKRLKDWSKSNILDDKQELEGYQLFRDQFHNIDSKIKEYIAELGYDDRRLYVDLNGKLVPIRQLELFRDCVMKDQSLSINERVKRSDAFSQMYLLKMKELEAKILDLSLINPDNVYLYSIASNIKIINRLLVAYSYYLAIQNSGVRVLDNSNGTTVADKLKALKDNIEIRTAEINMRIASKEIRKK